MVNTFALDPILLKVIKVCLKYITIAYGQQFQSFNRGYIIMLSLSNFNVYPSLSLGCQILFIQFE